MGLSALGPEAIGEGVVFGSIVAEEKMPKSKMQ